MTDHRENSKQRRLRKEAQATGRTNAVNVNGSAITIIKPESFADGFATSATPEWGRSMTTLSY